MLLEAPLWLAEASVVGASFALDVEHALALVLAAVDRPCRLTPGGIKTGKVSPHTL